ncbi:hypothetical protein E2P64_06475 [Candidatus Bathyarchaeota archaeon]|nr:hypothetical protein E2P64_06475 [Candidatus Bathyarchaeota archaeon]
MFVLFIKRIVLTVSGWMEERRFAGTCPTRAEVDTLIEKLCKVDECPKCGRPVKAGKVMLRCVDSYAKNGYKCDWELPLQFDIEEYHDMIGVAEILKMSVEWIEQDKNGDREKVYDAE